MATPSFKDLTGLEEQSESGIAVLRQAVAVLRSSEMFNEEMESGNYHSMNSVLREFAYSLHVHVWDWNNAEDYGSYQEAPCKVSGCYHTHYEED